MSSPPALGPPLTSSDALVWRRWILPLVVLGIERSFTATTRAGRMPTVLPTCTRTARQHSPARGGGYAAVRISQTATVPSLSGRPQGGKEAGGAPDVCDTRQCYEWRCHLEDGDQLLLVVAVLLRLGREGGDAARPHVGRAVLNKPKTAIVSAHTLIHDRRTFFSLTAAAHGSKHRCLRCHRHTRRTASQLARQAGARAKPSETMREPTTTPRACTAISMSSG